MVDAFLIGGENLEELALKEILRSKEEKRILTGKITGIEDEYYMLKEKIYHVQLCGITKLKY